MKRTSKKSGKVYLIGAGPGDPGLITVKAVEYIKKADVIVYDRLIPKNILNHRKPGAVLKYVGKAKGDIFDQQKINDILLACAKEGKMVVRLKGGDSFIFGRGSEEMLFLNENGVACELIPGVSSCYSVPEMCGIPLTHRGIASQFMVLTGHEDPAKKNEDINWKRAAKFKGTIVIMMGLSNLKKITDKLMEGGKSGATLAAVISHGTTRGEKIVVGTLSDIAFKSRALSAPAVTVIGDVVKIGFALNPELKPLSRRRYISTASETLNTDISRNLKRLGASVDCLPMMKIVPNKDTALLDKIIAGVKTFDWLVFTSRHGVRYFLKRYFGLGGKKQALSGRIACVGSGTESEFTKHGISADFMPEEFTTRDLAMELAGLGVKGKKIALLRTTMEKDYLKKILEDAGAAITDCVVYTAEDAGNKNALAKAVAKKSDGIFFLSPKSTKVFFNSIPARMKDTLKRRTPFYSIGPVTTRELKKFGARDIRSAKEHTVNGLVNLCLN